MEGARREESGGKLLAALGPAARQHLAAVLGRKTRPEAVAALADELAWLIGALHRRSRGKPENGEVRREGALLDEGSKAVKRRAAGSKSTRRYAQNRGFVTVAGLTNAIRPWGLPLEAVTGTLSAADL